MILLRVLLLAGWIRKVLPKSYVPSSDYYHASLIAYINMNTVTPGEKTYDLTKYSNHSMWRSPWLGKDGFLFLSGARMDHRDPGQR